MLSVMSEDAGRADGRSMLDEICREGARKMLAASLELEAQDYVAALVGEVDEFGHRLVTRNGHAQQRTITTVAGAVEIQAPRINDPADESRNWHQSKVQQLNRPALVPQESPGHRGAAAALPAWSVLG